MEKKLVIESTGLCTNDVVVKKVPYYVEICEEIFSVEPDRRCEYLYSKNIPSPKLSAYFSNYIKSNGRYVNEIADFRSEYSEYLKNKRLELINYEKELRYKETCIFFDRLIHDGFCSVPDYLNFSSDGNDIKKKAHGYVALIKRENAEKWESYVAAMNENKKNMLIEYSDKIVEFKNMIISGNADIVDYYTVIGMPRARFERVFYDNFSFLDRALFNKFLARYKSIPEGFNEEDLTKTNYSNNKAEISDDEKSELVNFMKKYNIPVQFYPVVLNKYIYGQLDIKSNDLKRKSSF